MIMMHFTEEEQRKEPKWSRWADDKLTDDEDSGSENCRRIVNNETTLLAPAVKPVSSVVAMPTNVPSTRQDGPSTTSTVDCRSSRCQPEACSLPLIPRRMEDDVLTVFCDDEIQDLIEDDISQPRIEITGVNTPSNRPNMGSPPSQPDLRETLKQRELRVTLNNSHSPRRRFRRRPEPRPYRRERPQREISGRQIVLHHRSSHDYHRQEVVFSDCYRDFQLPSRHRFTPYNGPGRREFERMYIPREEEPPKVLNPVINHHETCQASMLELVKQNNQLQSRLLQLEEQHREVLHRSIEQSNFISHNLAILAESQRNLVMFLLNEPPIIQRETSSITQRLQQAIARQRLQQNVYDDQVALYYC